MRASVPCWRSWAITTTAPTPNGIENNLEAIARSLALSVTEYFGVPFPFAAAGAGGGRVREQWNLLLRGAPATTARILARMPNGAPVRILNSYDDRSRRGL